MSDRRDGCWQDGTPGDPLPIVLVVAGALVDTDGRVLIARRPEGTRMAGLWVRKARAQWYSVRAELERELEAEELKRSLQDTQAALKQAQAKLEDEVAQAKTKLQEGADAAGRQLDGIRSQIEDRAVDASATSGAPDATGAVQPSGAATLPPAEGNDEPRRS